MNSLVSRRGMLCGAAALAGASVIGFSQSTPSPASPISNDVSSVIFLDREISFLVSSHPDFNAAMDSYFPALRSNSIIQGMLPLTALVLHRRGPGVRAMSTEWRISRQGQLVYQTYLRQHSTPLTKRRTNEGRAISSAGVDIIQAGEARLVTPCFTFTSQYYTQHPHLDLSSFLVQQEPGTFLQYQLSQAFSIGLQLDACVFSDGKVAGNDRGMLGKFVQATRNGERDEGICIAEMAAGNTKIVRHTLALHATALRTGSDDRETRWYEESRKQRAMFLLQVLDTKSPDTFARVLQRTQLQKKTLLVNMNA